jgi:glycosyltransferase involved in cell wall biosynthesis
MTIHGPTEFDAPIGLSLGAKMREALFVVAISHYCQSQLRRWLAPELWSKVEIVRCGVDAAFLESSTPVPETSKTLVSVGRLAPQKGHMVLLEAFQRVVKVEPDARLVFVGDGELRAAIERLAERLGIAARVRITGWLAGAAVRSEIERARALVLPSFAEGLPVVLMEALVLERPVISTYVAGIPELVVHGECGWLAPAGDVAALGRCLRAALAATPERLAEMGRAGAARVRSLHDATSEAAKLAERLREDAA